MKILAGLIFSFSIILSIQNNNFSKLSFKWFSLKIGNEFPKLSRDVINEWIDLKN